MIVVKIPIDRRDAFETKFSRCIDAFGHRTINELLSEVRYYLFKSGYKIDSIVTVYYILFYIFDCEPDITRWNICQPTDIISQRAQTKIYNLQLSNKLATFPA